MYAVNLRYMAMQEWNFMAAGRRRTLSIDPDLDARMVAVCEAFGVNVHSYILNEVGKAVVRDHLMINSQNNSNEVYEAINALIASSAEKQAETD
jgi:hypothetical protein